MTTTNERNPSTSSWQIRRRFMFAVSAFCMLSVLLVLILKLDTSPAEAAVTMAFITLASIVGSYVFGAVWEDTSKFKNKAGKE